MWFCFSFLIPEKWLLGLKFMQRRLCLGECGPHIASFIVGPLRVVSEMECADRVPATCHSMHFIQRMHKYFKWKRCLII